VQGQANAEQSHAVYLADYLMRETVLETETVNHDEVGGARG
jgi:hypothetical protein